MTRVIFMVHRSHGRIRYRLDWLREAKDEADRVADGLAALPGMESVEIRPFTGSVLCSYDPHELRAERIAEVLENLTQATHVVGPGEIRHAALESGLVRHALLDGSRVTRAAARMIEELNLDVLHASKGSVTLGSLAALGFLGASAAEIVGTGRLPLPPWYNLAWWAFRIFNISEKEVIADVKHHEFEEPAVKV